MSIHVEYKPRSEPIGPTRLRELVPYRVTSVRDGYEEVATGDIVMRFPCNTGGRFILNCTQQRMLFDRSADKAWCSSFLCLRAHDVRAIYFLIDNEDRPILEGDRVS